MNASFYLIRAGCLWRYLPKDFPRFTTVQNPLHVWPDPALWTRILCIFVLNAREAEAREASFTAVIVDSQSVNTTESDGPRGFDAGNTIKVRKRDLAVDTLGLPIACQNTVADVQDRDAPAPVLREVHAKSPWVETALVLGGYVGDEAQRAAFEASQISVTVVTRTDKQVRGFVVLPKRWIVEKTSGWIHRVRRPAKGFEATVEFALAWLQIAIVLLIIRRFARLA